LEKKHPPTHMPSYKVPAPGLAGCPVGRGE